MPDSKIKVSIIIPVYNVEKYLRECIRSVVSQKLREIEVFLIDDGSSDGSWDIIQEFAKRDRRIIAIQQANSGAAVARNRGLELASGEYIGFVDSDDYVDSDYYEQLYNAAVKYKADIARAYVKVHIISNGSNIIHSAYALGKYYNKTSVEEIRSNKLSLTSSNWLAIYRRSLLTKNSIEFIPGIRTGQDNIFNLHASYFANKVAFVDNPTYYHMIRRDGSLMTGYNFTTDGLVSRAMVVEETVRFLNSLDSYDKDIYVYRVADVLGFFHSRLIKTKIDKKSQLRLISILVPTWEQAKYKAAIRKLMRSEWRFMNSLNDEAELVRYMTYVTPFRRNLSRFESRRQALTGKVRRSKVTYKVLRPPVHALRKVNKLVSKLLS